MKATLATTEITDHCRTDDSDNAYSGIANAYRIITPAYNTAATVRGTAIDPRLRTRGR
jgi:hypothetical protein